MPLRLALLASGLLAAAPAALTQPPVAPAKPSPPAAQQPATPPPPPGAASTGFEACRQWTAIQVEKRHLKLSGAVECRRGDLALFADEAEIWTDTHTVILTGNVTFRQRDAQVTADRAEFDTETELGTFYHASGFAIISTKSKKNLLGGQEPDVYFYGDTIEKIGADRYRITHGGFTTCVQPTPRWQITSGSVTLRLDHYALLRNAVMEAKGVPIFYFPAIYYPIHKDDRATGFLLPTLGTSTYRGWSISNAFFWAIDRSQDLTFFDDWFSSRGNGFGVEYRYVSAPGSSGEAKFYRLAEHDSTILNTDGTTTSVPGDRSYRAQGSLTQALPGHWTARARVDYFTSLTVQQAYNSNIYDASNTTRTISASLSGMLGGFTLNGQYDRTEYFSDADNSTVTGGTPRIALTRSERPLFGTPLYYSLDGEYVTLTRESKTAGVASDRGLRRFDLMPTIRYPFTRWPFLTVNSSVSWRGTFWTRSLSPDGSGAVVDDPTHRSYFLFDSRVTGPVVSRVWSTPDRSFASKWKHSIEPYLEVRHVTSIGTFDRIVPLDGTDYILGGTTQLDYGVTNRLMAKRETSGSSNANELLSVVVSQTYYSNPQASLYDTNYSTSFSGLPPGHFSPVRLTVRATPTDQVNSSLKLEYDRRRGGLQSLGIDTQVGVGSWLRLTGGFSERLTSLLSGVPQRDRFLNGGATLKSDDNRVGASYGFNYDIGRSTLLTSRVMGYYNAQCCGFAVEYQTYSFGSTGVLSGLGNDHRFNFTVTLAGLGTFSNIFGAFGGGTSSGGAGLQ